MSPGYYSRKATLWMPMLVVVSLSITLAVNTAIAASPPPNKKNKHDSVSVQVVFGERDREVINHPTLLCHSEGALRATEESLL